MVSGLFWRLGCFDFVFFCLCMSLRLCFVDFRAFGFECFLVGNFERERSNGHTSSFRRSGMEMGTGENGGAS